MTTTESHRRFVLAARPSGEPRESDFRIESAPLRQPGAGEIAARVAFLSVDPYMRSRMRDAPSYAPPVGLGETMTGAGVARVTASHHPAFSAGDWIAGITGWQSHWVGEPRGFFRIDPELAPPSAYLGVLGHTGLTAYFGLLDIGHPKPGETLVVSGAAGAVGSIAGQIGKIHGCRVVGVAGADEKVRWVVNELGFDAAFNYKTVSDYRRHLAPLCPAGIDIYFDNTGGPVSDAVMALLNVKARIAVCGQISQYNLEEAASGPRLDWLLIVKRARKEGFLVTDYAARFPEGRAALAAWLREGRLQHREHFVDGFENTPRAFLDMMRGENIGKTIVRL